MTWLSVIVEFVDICYLRNLIRNLRPAYNNGTNHSTLQTMLLLSSLPSRYYVYVYRSRIHIGEMELLSWVARSSPNSFFSLSR
jgi:predicted permease